MDGAYPQLRDRIAHFSDTRPGAIIALTGSVASGKTTLAETLAGDLGQGRLVETVSTDGFLFPNAVLEARDLMNRKGFPESYDRALMARTLSELRAGAAEFPAHSHVIYDIDPALSRRIERPDLLILEGLGFAPPSRPERGEGEPDLLVYLDAELADIEAWFLERFLRLWRAAADDPASFYARFQHMSQAEAEAFAMTVWNDINRPNLENHILPLREHADIVVRKDRGHALEIVADRV